MPTTINELTIEPRTPPPPGPPAPLSPDDKPIAETERETVQTNRRAREREMRLWTY